ncbi:MAG: Ig-like domain-containing protein, partial [Verrucomicrobia bacterium]|nr:Ig-like domain-containing protein [Verrucomicrobiota bacterium]
MKKITLIAAIIGFMGSLPARAIVPAVAIHDSELTRTLENLPASATTPRGAGTTGFEWWPTQWHYFVMPESLKEALHSDGTAFTVVSDAEISAGKLLDSNGNPQFPIMISLAAEAMNDSEIQPLLDYVSAGGTLFVGSSSFTRKSDGTTRGDFAIANSLGVHMVNANLSNWGFSYSLSKQTDHRLIAHLPSGVLTWKMPWNSEEIPWGTSPSHPYWGPHPAWRVQAGDAQTIAQNDFGPYLLVKSYGRGRFIYEAAFQPLIAHGGWAPGMYSYAIFRNAIQWAFESQAVPVPRLSPWPYPYDAALNVRHDFENSPDAINSIETSARYEHSLGAKGDYYFCTGTLRVDMANSAATIESLRRAVTNYDATIGPHNGGLSNPNNPALTNADFDYWHWGLDEALDTTPNGFANGKAYALASLGNAFQDIEGWLSGINNAKGLRVCVSPYFNSTREDSYDIGSQLGVVAAGEQKLTPFPHWTLSTRTSGKRYSTLSLPVSDWYVGTTIAQSLEYHSTSSLHAAVDYYYNLGALINIYTHASSTSGLEKEYVTYSLAKPRLWAANATDVYAWWGKRDGAQVVPTVGTNGAQVVLTLSITGATDPQTAVETWIPQPAFSGLEVRRNGVLASTSEFRTSGQLVRVLVGNAINTVEIRYSTSNTTPVTALNDAYTVNAGQSLTVAAPGLLGNDTGNSSSLTAALVSGPSHGTLNLNPNGGFTYAPTAGFSGTDSFTYSATDSVGNSGTASALITVAPAVNQPPVVALVSPADGASYPPPATITVTASASDSDGSISKIEFYNGATNIATLTT